MSVLSSMWASALSACTTRRRPASATCVGARQRARDRHRVVQRKAVGRADTLPRFDVLGEQHLTAERRMRAQQALGLRQTAEQARDGLGNEVQRLPANKIANRILSDSAMPTMPVHCARQPRCRVAHSIVGLLAASSMAACEAKTPPDAVSASQAPAEAAVNPKLRALLDKTLKNLRFVEGGTFQMGDFGPLHSPDKLFYSSNPNNKPLHKVTLDSFSMSAYKTTYADHDVYSEVTGKPKVGTDNLTKEYRYPDGGAGLSWQQARDYCQWLGVQLNLPMDLPSEAQWEYAARNRGQFFVFATDNGRVDAGRNVWEYDQRNAYIEKHKLRIPGPSLPLGQFPPTPLGLYDMMTDGFEWVLDWYAPDYYAVSPEKGPSGPQKGNEKVMRSFRSSTGEALSHGDGLSISRGHREPDPPKTNYKGETVPDRNMNNATVARCVLNSLSPVLAK